MEIALLKLMKMLLLVMLICETANGFRIGSLTSQRIPLIIKKVGTLSLVNLPGLAKAPITPKLPSKPPPFEPNEKECSRCTRSILPPPLLLPPLIPTLPLLPPPILPILPPLLPLPLLPILPPILPKLPKRLKPLRVPILSKSSCPKLPKLPDLKKDKKVLDKLLNLKKKGSLTTAEFIRFKKLLLK